MSYSTAATRYLGCNGCGQTPVEDVVAATVIAEESTAAPGDSLVPMIAFTGLVLAMIAAYGVSR
jgi:hypothetical protein